jgi:hypothetical protein
MHTFSVMLTTTVLVLTAPGPALARCNSDQTTHVGPASGDPEKDTFGRRCASADLEGSNSFVIAPRELQKVGASTGESEKDTLGYAHRIGAQ